MWSLGPEGGQRAQCQQRVRAVPVVSCGCHRQIKTSSPRPGVPCALFPVGAVLFLTISAILSQDKVVVVTLSLTGPSFLPEEGLALPQPLAYRITHHKTLSKLNSCLCTVTLFWSKINDHSTFGCLCGSVVGKDVLFPSSCLGPEPLGFGGRRGRRDSMHPAEGGCTELGVKVLGLWSGELFCDTLS